MKFVMLPTSSLGSDGIESKESIAEELYEGSLDPIISSLNNVQ